FSFFYSRLSSCYPSALHSFPTRRSSDLYSRIRQMDGGEDHKRQRRNRSGPRDVGSDPTRWRLRIWPNSRSKGLRNRHRESIWDQDRKSTRLNSSHGSNSYAVFCLKKKKR